MITSKAWSSLSFDERGLIINRTQDVEPILNDVRSRQSAGLVGSKEMRHVARVPTVLIEGAANEAGIDLSDAEAVRELIYNKVTSGEWANFKVHEGGY